VFIPGFSLTLLIVSPTITSALPVGISGRAAAVTTKQNQKLGPA